MSQSWDWDCFKIKMQKRILLPPSGLITPESLSYVNFKERREANAYTLDNL